ncbi:MAG: PH domain-containing protein [Acetobacteraceae bacterium]|nr:PH domain-containing protein [Acetobacteraceae bacterium]
MKRVTSIREHENEPIPGLPERLPAGEGVVWQGSPRWAPLAKRAFHLRGLAIYFGVLVAWRVAEGVADGSSWGAALASAWTLLLLAPLCLGVLAGIGYMMARSALYTVTNRRVVLRVGVALPMTINIPFSRIETAAVRRHADGTEDIVLTLAKGHRIAWLALWPHARPWRLTAPEPMLRALPVTEGAAQVLSRALAASAGQEVAAPATDEPRRAIRLPQGAVA